QPLERVPGGFWAGDVSLAPAERYRFLVDGAEREDPCARARPEGVRGPSAAVDTRAFEWTDAGRRGLGVGELVLYELHVGTFTEVGTFAAAAERLAGLRELGVTAIELMPVATFPGRRGWGYDGLYTWAPHEAYGGPAELALLVDAAHAEGLGVVLDVVYNHVGPGSEALRALGPYFTGRLGPTPWGDALDYRRPGVREWALQNAEQWVRDYHVDGLRLDAARAVRDDSPVHVFRELAERVRALGTGALVIAEMGMADLRPLEEWGHDAMWLDALHHELHVALTGERDGYYAPHDGSMTSIRRELLRPERERLVVCAQNHDQVGNRALGDRLPPGKLRLAAACCLFSESIPLLFQGEEYAETRPFLFFTDHVDPRIADATREGRRREFAAFAAFAGEHVPDPQDLDTFQRSVLDRTAADVGHRALYERLLRLRPQLPRALAVEADDDARRLVLRRGDVRLVLDFAAETVELVEP
ncbi:MAG TPA: alpha-amylase family glycosyl hydrolase, partial [Gaiellaceae bacterium]|nr:alpha-amylase family glycosyl hydrolase [Gaiellaceae bacterium]